jgi:hypothetical protein
MYLIIGKIIGVILSIIPLVGLTVKPYWEASELASSKSGYLLWALPSSLVGITLLAGTGYIVWNFIRQIRPAMLVVGALTILFGIGLQSSSAEMLEKAAPELYQVGKGIWIKTTIHDYTSGGRRSSRGKGAVAANVRLADGTTVQALTFSRWDKRSFSEELYRDLSGVYWVGDPDMDETRKVGGVYIFMGLIVMCLALIFYIGPVRRYVFRYIYGGD